MRHLNWTAILFVLLNTPVKVVSQNLKPYEQALPGSTIKFKMIPIRAGVFTIGSPSTETGREEDEGPQKEVSISEFWMAEHEVTFGEWDVFFKSIDVPQTKVIAVDAVSRPTAQYIDLTWGMGRDPRQPTNSMSQAAAIMYCKWLYEETGVFYRLPTEAEWEYGCRAGTNAAYLNDKTPQRLKEYAYFKENSQGKYQKVGQLKPNAWGLYDMQGNLSEWTLDQYDAVAYQKLPDNAKDPLEQPTTRYPRVVRGGSYLSEAKDCRCANRVASLTDWNKRDPQIPKSRWWLTDGMTVGFRLVRPAVQPSEAEIEKFFARYLK